MAGVESDKELMGTVVLGKNHWMLYWLVTAMYPQFLITLDEMLKEKAITVRVGQAVNTVGLAGVRMGISGVSAVSTFTMREMESVTCADHGVKSVPNASNTGEDCHWRTSRIGNERVLPVPKRLGRSGHFEKVGGCTLGLGVGC